MPITGVIALLLMAGAPPDVAAVHVNEHAYLPEGAKRATVATGREAPLVWRVLDADGAVAAEGETTPFGADRASGDTVQTIDFSALDVSGDGYRLEVEDARSAPFAVTPDAYASLKHDALAFFYHQRASTPIDAALVGAAWARPTAHDPDTATCYGPEDFRGNDWGGCPYALDVSRGWYDAGDQGKYVVNGGVAVWTLLNYHERFADDDAFADGRVAIPERGNGVDDLLDEARWELEFMLAMQVPDGTTLTLPRGNQYRHQDALTFETVDASGLVHHKIGDERWTPLPTPPHLDPETRYLAYPSTAATLNLAAVAAQCARIWADIDAAFSSRCLTAAVTAYAAAKRLPDLYAIDVTDGGSGGYGDANLDDEFYWAAAELYATTREARYDADMRASPLFLAFPQSDAPAPDISWGSVGVPGSLSLLAVDGALPPADRETAVRRLTQAADAYAAESAAEGYGVPFSGVYTWGSSGDIANRGVILGTAYAETGDARHLAGVTAALDYLLGRNPLGQSYISGYGDTPMVEPHHRFWAHALDPDLPPPPPGAVAGGANQASPADPIARRLIVDKKCKPQRCYADDHRAYALNEVAVNWNAPVFWIAAARDHFHHQGH